MVKVFFTIPSHAPLDGCESIHKGCLLGVITGGSFQETGIIISVEKQGDGQGPCSYVKINDDEAYYVPYSSKPTNPKVTVMNGKMFDIVKVTVKVTGELPLLVSTHDQTFEVPI